MPTVSRLTLLQAVYHAQGCSMLLIVAWVLPTESWALPTESCFPWMILSSKITLNDYSVSLTL